MTDLSKKHLKFERCFSKLRIAKSLSNVPFRLNQRNSGEFNSPVPSELKEDGTGKLDSLESFPKFKELFALMGANLELIDATLSATMELLAEFKERQDKLNERLYNLLKSKSSDIDLKPSFSLANTNEVQNLDNDKLKIDPNVSNLQIKALNGSEMGSTSKCQASCEFESKTPDIDLNSSIAFSNKVKSQIVDGNEPKFFLNDSNLQINIFNGSEMESSSKFQTSDEFETSNKNFLIEECSRKVNFPRSSDINEEDLRKFTFPERVLKPSLAKEEFDNLKAYFYQPPKFPVCGDYRDINRYLLGYYGLIPRIFDEIARIISSIANTPLLASFNALGFRINRLLEFLYLYSTYWE